MKKLKYWISIALAGVFALGMGGAVSDTVTDIPEPDRNYSVVLIDQSDVTLDLENFSFAGHTYVTGKFGKAVISIDFEKIDSMTFLLEENNVRALVRLKESTPIEILMEKNGTAYGEASFGNIRIEVQDIKQVQIHGKVLTSN